MTYISEEFITIVKRISQLNSEIKSNIGLHFLRRENEDCIEYTMLVANHLNGIYATYDAGAEENITPITYKVVDWKIYNKCVLLLTGAYEEEAEEEKGRKLTEEEIKECKKLADREYFTRYAKEICNKLMEKETDKSKKLIVSADNNTSDDYIAEYHDSITDKNIIMQRDLYNIEGIKVPLVNIVEGIKKSVEENKNIQVYKDYRYIVSVTPNGKYIVEDI